MNYLQSLTLNEFFAYRESMDVAEAGFDTAIIMLHAQAQAIQKVHEGNLLWMLGKSPDNKLSTSQACLNDRPD